MGEPASWAAIIVAGIAGVDYIAGKIFSLSCDTCNFQKNLSLGDIAKYVGLSIPILLDGKWAEYKTKCKVCKKGTLSIQSV